jgi:hypothetical protein
MICSKCKYYAPLIGRSYDLSKCLKFLVLIKPSMEKCKGNYFKEIVLGSNEQIKNKDKR